MYSSQKTCKLRSSASVRPVKVSRAGKERMLCPGRLGCVDNLEAARNGDELEGRQVDRRLWCSKALSFLSLPPPFTLSIRGGCVGPAQRGDTFCFLRRQYRRETGHARIAAIQCRPALLPGICIFATDPHSTIQQCSPPPVSRAVHSPWFAPSLPLLADLKLKPTLLVAPSWQASTTLIVLSHSAPLSLSRRSNAVSQSVGRK